MNEEKAGDLGNLESHMYSMTERMNNVETKIKNLYNDLLTSTETSDSLQKVKMKSLEPIPTKYRNLDQTKWIAIDSTLDCIIKEIVK